MEPTAEQLANRLKANPTTISGPGGSGIFRATGDYGNQIHYIENGKLSSVGTDTLLTEAERRAAGSSGVIATKALERLKSQYGIDYSTLPEYNLGDVLSSPDRFGLTQSFEQVSSAGRQRNYQFGGSLSDISRLAPVSKSTSFQANTQGATLNQQTSPGMYKGVPIQGGTEAEIQAQMKNIDSITTVKDLGTPVGAPTNSGGVSSPTLPVPQAGSTVDAFNTSLTTQLADLKKQLETENAKRAADYQTQISNLEQKQKDLQILMDNGMAGNFAATQKSAQDKQAALDLEKQRVDENYNANQSLINEMNGLLTTGNQVIEQMKGTTGLASIMNPRIAQTVSDVAARAGIIKTLIDARNGQIGVAQSQLQSTVNTVTSIAKDQIDYYKTLVDYYQNQKSENGAKLISLTKDQKEYLDAKVTALEASIKSTQATADIIQKAMLDPDTALAYASAGVSLNDTPAQINAKLATYAQAKAIKDTNQKMILDGYSASPIPGGVAYSDGNGKTWYKAGTGTSNTDPLKTADYIKAETFITDNPNATYDEIKNGIIQNTKLTSGEADTLMASKGINKTGTADVKRTIQQVKDSGISRADAEKSILSTNKLTEIPENIKAILDEVYGEKKAVWYNPLTWF